MERELLFREVSVNVRNDVEPPLPLEAELSAQDVAKYQALIKPRIKSNRDANALTNQLFYDKLYPALKEKKLTLTDKEYVKNQWLDIYYQVVLPLLGISKQRLTFDYPADLRQRIDQIRERFDKMHHLIFAIRPKTPSAADFDAHPEVSRTRVNARNLLNDTLLPLLMEGLNLNDPDKVYKALFSLDNGRLVDTIVDIMAHNPALLPKEAQERYLRIKTLAVNNIKTEIKNHLLKRRPSDIQTGGEVKSTKGENIESKPKPDNPKFAITGRFEYINRVDPQQPFGMVLCLNQAGNWAEGVLSLIGNPQVYTDNPKFFYRFYVDLRDWSKPAPMIHIRGNTDAFKANIKLAVKGNDSLQVIMNERPVDLRRVIGKPVATERHLTFFQDNPLARQTEWFPILSLQTAAIKSYFKTYTGYQPILKFAKFQSAAAIRNRTLNIKQLIISAAKGDSVSLDLAATCLDQFFAEMIHGADKDIAGFYIRYYLNQTYFDKGDGWKLSLASWLYRSIRIAKRYEFRPFVKSIYGTGVGDAVTPVANQLYQYQIEVEVFGFGIGFIIKGGYYRGNVTIKCKQWEELGAKDASGSKVAKMKIQMGELGGGYVKSINFGQSFGGVAESDVLWMPKDFEGLISVMKVDAEIGINIVEIRKKIGISQSISGTIGTMEIVGNSNLPPLNFGIYSLSPTTGGIENEMDREGPKSPLGPEVTASVVVGSIWKNGSLPAPKDAIKYGSEKAILDAMYKGDGKAHFKHDSALLTAAAENLLRKLCANELVMLSSPTTKMTITGHTDRSGKDAYNITLSKNRATNVKRKLLDICGDKFKAIRDIVPEYKGEEEAQKHAKALLAKGIKAPEYDPKFRKVDIAINGKLVLTLVSD